METPALLRQLCRCLLAPLLLSPFAAAQNPAQSAPSNPAFTLKLQSDIVLTNVIVRDKKTGALVTNLTANDFTIKEDGSPQHLITFDYQNANEAAVLNEKNSKAPGKTSIADMLNGSFAASPEALKDHRLIVLFFDLSTLQPEDLDRAVEAATDYINKSMQPADLVAVVSLSTSLSLDQDFTANKQVLLQKVAAYNGSEGTGFANGTTGGSDGTADNAASFTADDTEYNDLNTDRELFAIRDIARALEHTDGRKSLLYLSGGLSRNGIENQASLRAATNEAVKANMAIYSVDSRGLQAILPVGDASTGSLRGSASYSGTAVQSNLTSNFDSQELLATLSSDTGGKAFFDTNDFAPAFQQIQHDTEAYYILGFRSSNPNRDGRYRHLSIKVNRPDLKLDYRPGYYAPADFKHATSEDRELQLTEQLRSDLPATDVALYLQPFYFRAEGETDRFYVPISLIVPGSQIPFLKNGDQDKATLDIAGQVKDAQGIIVGNVRDTVKLKLDAAQQAARRNIQYGTGFLLAAGRYHLKFVVRENQTGAIGSFETDLQVPDWKPAPKKSAKPLPVRLSSIVVSSQRVPVTGKSADKHGTSPLIRDGVEWVPNLPHLFRQDQHLYFLYELYDPTHEVTPEPQTASPTPVGLVRRNTAPVRVLTSIEFLHNGTKVFETPPVAATAINEPGRNAIEFQFDVALAQLPPGDYLCQVNVIDDAGATFTFPRLALRIQPPAQTPSQ